MLEALKKCRERLCSLSVRYQSNIMGDDQQKIVEADRLARAAITTQLLKPYDGLVAEAYASVYETEGRRWISTANVSPTIEQIRTAQAEYERTIPYWCRDNKFIAHR